MTRDSRRLAFAALCAAVLALCAHPTPARAELSLDITRGNPQPLPIAIPDLGGGSAGHEIAQVVTADLEHSGLFRPIDPSAFIQNDTGPTPRFADWKLINAQALVTGNVTQQGDGRLRVEFRLWDVFAGTQLTGTLFTAPPQNWRRIAHKIADAVYSRLTGETGYFDTRIVYVSESGPAQRRVKRLAIMDQDGFNHHFLTSGNSLVLTPRFSPTAQEITYLSYASKIPQVYLFNIQTGQQEVLGRFPGMTFAPRFSPDGSRIVFSMSTGANSSIYTMDLATHHLTQITHTNAIDTAPSYSPDGQRIAFESDRGGAQQIYVMNADGSGQQRISFGSGHYATPVWSPRGDTIAFTKFEGDRFSIGVMGVDGHGERILTSGFLAEGPTWAPNGRVLAYYKQSPTSRSGAESARLYSIDVTGSNERELVTPQDGSDPAWSPLLP